jgi:hypothetical protein
MLCNSSGKPDMQCEFCLEQEGKVRRLAPTSLAASLAQTEALVLCDDCHADLLEVTTPVKVEE